MLFRVFLFSVTVLASISLSASQFYLPHSRKHHVSPPPDDGCGSGTGNVVIAGTPPAAPFQVSSNNDSPLSYDIPVDAEAVVVVVSGTTLNPSAILFDQMNWDDGGTQDFTEAVSESRSPGGGSRIESYIMTCDDSKWPGTGSQLLYVNGPNDSYDDGYLVYVFSVKNLNAIAPVGDTDTRQGANSNWVSSLTGVGINDLVIGAGNHYADPCYAAPSGSGQTALAETNFRYAGICVGYKLNESAFRLDNFYNTLTASAFVIEAAEQ